MEITCFNCKRIFSVCQSWAERGRKYCSRECQNDYFSSETYFSQFVDFRGNDECWNWTGTTTKGGYGRVGTDYAHRIAARNAGVLTDESKYVCHSCDNRLCVNPKHLFQGTHQENVADMVNKGRNRHGESVRTARLSRKDVLAIRASTGMSQRELAKQYGVTQSAINFVIHRKTWKHLR